MSKVVAIRVILAEQDLGTIAEVTRRSWFGFGKEVVSAFTCWKSDALTGCKWADRETGLAASDDLNDLLNEAANREVHVRKLAVAQELRKQEAHLRILSAMKAREE